MTFSTVPLFYWLRCIVTISWVSPIHPRSPLTDLAVLLTQNQSSDSTSASGMFSYRFLCSCF
ncbi:hypothetical protein M758_4G247400 [Ceratodon purpureus]|nr:hypothetical protein M758_4G247400 [Ceratodon purpureus]